MPACETRTILTITDYDIRSLYLDLLRRNLNRYGMHEQIPSGGHCGGVSFSKPPTSSSSELTRIDLRILCRVTSGVFASLMTIWTVKACEQAVTDYRAKHGISAEIVDIDGTGVLCAM
jgi:hypothetical protein